jgi:hypothetical protein
MLAKRADHVHGRIFPERVGITATASTSSRVEHSEGDGEAINPEGTLKQ